MSFYHQDQPGPNTTDALLTGAKMGAVVESPPYTIGAKVISLAAEPATHQHHVIFYK